MIVCMDHDVWTDPNVITDSDSSTIEDLKTVLVLITERSPWFWTSLE
jgi:hypothetical protein